MTSEDGYDCSDGLRGQVAVITGASRGLGRVYAEKLAGLGARVVLMARNRDTLDSVAAAIRANGGEAVAIVADVTDQISVTRAFADVDANLGCVDLLINSAGNLGVTGASWELEAMAWWDTMALHLLGSFHCMQEAMRRMVGQGGGRIINLASHAGAFRWPTVSAYSVAKAALIKLTENVAVEARMQGIYVFAIHPGIVRGVGLAETMIDARDTPNSALLDVAAWIQHETVMGHAVNADRGAQMVADLASGRYDFLNGRYITVYDDLSALSLQADRIRKSDAMTMRIHPVT
jgi:NAD(P)-dependent dehydrogenase (short-subunit alcohol dehydrogenase family)